MGRENGFAYQILVLIVIIIIAIAGVCINKVVGKKGVIDRVTTVEKEYSKEEVLEKINHKITQKFIEINNQAKQENKSISELYNSEVVINFLIESGVIEPENDETGNRNIWLTLVKTYLTYAFSGLVLTTALTYLEHNILGIAPILIPVINLVITTPINFIISKLWTYKGKKEAV